MKDIPIIFSGPMVRALLDGRKTMTRRLAWLEPRNPSSGRIKDSYQRPSRWQDIEPGDRLWVREAFVVESSYDVDIDYKPPFSDGRPVDYRQCDDRGHYWCQPHYRATDTAPALTCDRHDGPCCHWRPAFHMPRWASRLTLIVTATKIEPLLDITEDDARAEGCTGWSNFAPGPKRDIGDGRTVQLTGEMVSPVGEFQMLWARLHPKWDGFSSPEVVALTFTVHRQNIDTLPKAEAA